jgi:hypothetical protein
MLSHFYSLFRKSPGFLVAWLVVCTITTNRLQAQPITQTVKGTVIDKASEKPLVGVSVQVTGMPGGVITDSTGSYKLVNVPVGRQRL